MRKNLGVLAVALPLALSLSSGVAKADAGIHDIGDLSARGNFGYVYSETPGVGSFSDFFQFTLPSSFDVGSSAVNTQVNVFGNVFYDITGLSMSLYQGIAGDATADTLLSSGLEIDRSLGMGTYYFKVDGTATGKVGGFYTFGAVAAVPEPETYALMLAGLGLVGFAARRRKSTV